MSIMYMVLYATAAECTLESVKQMNPAVGTIC